MKHLLITTIAAVLLMGCGPLQSNAKSLHRAAEEGDIEAVKKHLAAGANKNVRAGKWRDTPLHRAAFWGYTEIVELLINNEVDVNAKDKYGCTPLHDAAEYSHLEIAEMLISKGATSPLASTLLAPNSTTAVCAIRSLAAPWPTPTKNATGASSPTLLKC
mgnify:CR=1 FL=1